MDKSEWYENRILWRAKNFHLNDYVWQNFLLSNESSARKILKAADGHGAPIFVFWLSDDVWTLLTTQFLLGMINGTLSAVDLDKLGKICTINNDKLPPNELKRRAEFICAGEDRKIFWTPAGNTHFSLFNILMMFPVNVP